ncbi:hypothetical protein [Streptomyces sp. S1A1-8]|uniref:hypothetical protein n=1 Tax=Streptomyces sp. S1A1-8 TaxID=2594460 RepID=UPI0019682E7B|nr:hypothetical protein [Streptomyces sp. S1A1-8]
MGVDLPVAAERFPRLFLYWADGGCRARVEHEQRRLVLLDQGAGGLRVGRVGDNRDERRTQSSVHVRQVVGGARNTDDLVTLVDQCGGDRRSEAAAGSGDHRRGL